MFFEALFMNYRITIILLAFVLLQKSYCLAEVNSENQVEDSEKAELLIKDYLRNSDRLLSNSPDSADYFITKALDLAERYDLVSWKVESLISRAMFFQKISNYEQSLEQFFDLRKLIEVNDELYIRYGYRIFSGIGSCYIKLGRSDEAIIHLTTAKQLGSELYDSGSKYFSGEEYLKVLLNLGAAQLILNKDDKAELVYKEALEFASSLQEPLLPFEASINNNLGIIDLKKKPYNKAFSYYNTSKEIWESLSDTLGLAQSFNNIGNYYFLTNNMDSATYYFNKASKFALRKNSYRSALIASYGLFEVSKKLNNTTSALNAHMDIKRFSDSIFNQASLLQINRIELQYEVDKMRYELELQQQKQLAKKDKQLLLTYMITGAIFLLLIIAILFFLLQRAKINRSKLRENKMVLEAENLELEKRNLENELSFKNKELATNVLYMLKKNEFITNFATRLLSLKDEVKSENKKIIEQLVRELKRNTEDSIWQEFEVRFQQVHNDFYDRLQEKFPDLTPNERKLCAFLRLNMSTKDISAITFQSLNSITVARFRLRKQLGIEREENIINFLMNL